MFRVNELTQFGTLTCDPATQLPSAALVGAAWTQTNDDPFFAEIDPTAMGYRRAPRGFASSDARRKDRAQRQKASKMISTETLGRALLRFGGGTRDYAGA